MQYAINRKTLNYMQQYCVLSAVRQFLCSWGAAIIYDTVILQLINRRINYEINWDRDSFYGSKRRLP